MNAHLRCVVGLVTLLIPHLALAQAAESPPFAVQISVDAAQIKGDMRPIWRYFGADEPNYAYMKDGAKLIKELGELGPQGAYFRAHNLLTTGDGTPALKWGSTNAYTEDASGKPIYDWTIVDRIIDTYRERNVRPYLQLGFMPEALSTKPEPYQHHWTPKAKYDEIYTGWAYPPKDYGKWEILAQPRLSPKGDWVAVGVNRVDEENQLRIRGGAKVPASDLRSPGEHLPMILGFVQQGVTSGR